VSLTPAGTRFAPLTSGCRPPLFCAVLRAWLAGVGAHTSGGRMPTISRKTGANYSIIWQRTAKWLPAAAAECASVNADAHGAARRNARNAFAGV
jgi:hypothetical protein